MDGQIHTFITCCEVDSHLKIIGSFDVKYTNIHYTYKRLTHKQNVNFTYLLRHYKLFRACDLFRCLTKN